MRLLFISFVIVLTFKTSVGQVKERRGAIIQGSIASSYQYDSLRLYVYQDVLTDPYYSNPSEIFTVPVVNGKFKIVAHPTSGPVYGFLHTTGPNLGTMGIHVIMSYFIMLPSDSVYIYVNEVENKFFSPGAEKYKERILAFEGVGAEKYKCLYEMASVNKNRNAIADSIRRILPDTTLLRLNIKAAFAKEVDLHGFRNFEVRKNIQHALFQQKGLIIAKYKSVIEQPVYDIMQRDNYYEAKYWDLYSFWESYRNFSETSNMRRSILPMEQENLLKITHKQFQKYYEDSILDKTGVNLVDLNTLSRKMLEYIFYSHIVRIVMAKTKGDLDNLLYAAFENEKNPLLRDRLIARLFLDRFRFFNDSNSMLNKARKTIKHNIYREIVNKFQSGLIGSKALQFELPNKYDSLVGLESFKGKVVFVDFWYTGCSNCSIYYKHAVKPAELFFQSDTNVVFITISTDYSKQKWLEALQSGRYTSDGHVNVHNLYTGGRGFRHPIISGYNITSYPRPLLIDKKGKIFKTSGDDLRSPDSLLSSIKSALYK